MGKYKEYSSVTYWAERGGIGSRWRGQWSDMEQWFPSFAEFRRAARKQIKDGTAHQTTTEHMNTWRAVYGN